MKKTVNKPKKFDTPPPQDPDQFLILGHLIKYNLYLLSKAVVFSSIVSKSVDLETVVEDTHKIMQQLDLDFRKKSE